MTEINVKVEYEKRRYFAYIPYSTWRLEFYSLEDAMEFALHHNVNSVHNVPNYKRERYPPTEPKPPLMVCITDQNCEVIKTTRYRDIEYREETYYSFEDLVWPSENSEYAPRGFFNKDEWNHYRGKRMKLPWRVSHALRWSHI